MRTNMAKVWKGATSSESTIKVVKRIRVYVIGAIILAREKTNLTDLDALKVTDYKLTNSIGIASA